MVIQGEAPDGSRKNIAVGEDGGLATQLTGSNTAEDATIESGASLSGALNLGGRSLVGLKMPAAWTAASLTFEVSQEDADYVPLYWNGAEYTIEAAGGADAGLGVSLEPAAFAGWNYVKIRSGTAGTPVNQGAQRVIKAISRVV